MVTTTFGDLYTTGTVTATHNSVSVTGSGVLWTDIEQGDIFESQGLQATIDTVASGTLTLKLPWSGAGGAGLAYVIRKDSKARFDPSLTQAKLRELLAVLEGAVLLYAVEGDAPDDNLGEDGQWALKTNDGPWELWLKVTGSWVQQGPPVGGLIYDVTGFSPDRPGSNENILSMLMVRAVTFPAGLTASQATASANATSTAVFTIKKTSAGVTTNIGTVTFASGTKIGTFAMATSVTFAAGDVIDVVGPNPRDATLTDIHVTLAGFRN